MGFGESALGMDEGEAASGVGGRDGFRDGADGGAAVVVALNFRGEGEGAVRVCGGDRCEDLAPGLLETVGRRECRAPCERSGGVLFRPLSNEDCEDGGFEPGEVRSPFQFRGEFCDGRSRQRIGYLEQGKRGPGGGTRFAGDPEEVGY